MEENRRGFLKTLGKLGVALGITTAACSAHHHGHHDPHSKHPKPTGSPDDGFQLASEAKSLTTPKANGKPIIEDLTYKTSSISPSWHERTTSALKPGDPIKIRAARAQDLQDDLNAYTNMRMDVLATKSEMSMLEHPPQMVVPQSVYDYMRGREAVRQLDPYNWGAVFALKWYDWDGRDPQHATVVGRWEATVKPEFYGVFEHECYYQSKAIAMEYLASRVTNVEAVKKHAKRDCYLTLVETLQDKILERIKQEVKNQPIMSNVCLISNRDTTVLTGITD